MRAAVLLCMAAAFLAACAPFAGSLNPGVSTEAEARQRLGPPAAELADKDGKRLLFYTTGPQGTQTYRVALRNDGVVESVEQVLTDDRVLSIQSGVTSSDEVLRLIGPPWRRVRFTNLNQEAWDYVFQDAWGYYVDYAVMIDTGGIVASKVHTRRERGRDSRH